MDNSNETFDYRKALYASFGLDEHEIREGSKAKSGKVQYFVYVRREAIQHRLDDLFFMQWELTYNEPIVTPSFVSVTAAITINGIRKEYNGGARPKGKEMSEDTAKAAYTDAFKRCASMWGIGLYLQNTPQIWTDGYADGNWNEKKSSENAAWDKFAAWFKGEPEPKQKPAAPKATTPKQEQPTGNGNGNGNGGNVTVLKAFPDRQAAAQFEKDFAEAGVTITREEILIALNVSGYGAYEGTLEQATADVNKFLLNRAVGF